MSDNKDILKEGYVHDDMEAFRANNQAFKKGIAPEEAISYYNIWSQQGQYDKDLCTRRYNGPIIAGNTVSKYLNEDKKNRVILDVAAGTGYVGQELVKHGFSVIDALEPSTGMIKEAKTKNIYRNFIASFLNRSRLPIDDGIYDCCVSSGGMGEGHIPCEGLYELIRITKSGGFVIIVMREEYLETVEEYRNRLEPLMETFIDSGAWQRLERTLVSNYAFGLNGVLYVFKVC